MNTRGVRCARLVAIASAVAGIGLGASHGADAADLIFHNGKVLSVDAKFSVHSAIAVRGERILAIGSDADVLKTKGDRTQLIDLAGKTVLPGLIDSHVHPTGAAMTEFDHPVPEMENDRRRAGLRPRAGRGRARGRVDQRPPGVHHPAPGAALSRRGRSWTDAAPENPVALLDRARRLAQLAGAEAQRHRQGLQASTAPGRSRRTRDRRADRHPPQLHAVREGEVAGEQGHRARTGRGG